MSDDLYDMLTAIDFSRDASLETGHERFAWAGVGYMLDYKARRAPDRLRILKGYHKPEYSNVTGGVPEFNDWIGRTIKLKEVEVLHDSCTFLDLLILYYDHLHEARDYLPKDHRVHKRIITGFKRLTEHTREYTPFLERPEFIVENPIRIERSVIEKLIDRFLNWVTPPDPRIYVHPRANRS